MDHAFSLEDLGEAASAALVIRSRKTGRPISSLIAEAVEKMLRRDQNNPPYLAAEQAFFSGDYPRTTPTTAVQPIPGSEDNREELHVPLAEAIVQPSREIFAASTRLAEELHLLSLQERIPTAPSRDAPKKRLLLRECRRDYGRYSEAEEKLAHWRSGVVYELPISKLDWLISALTEAREALKAEQKTNLQSAQKALLDRSPEAIAYAVHQREYWIALRGKEAWQRAVSLAGHHRAGAARRGHSEHFTAWEWLALCERFGFCCPVCRRAERSVKEITTVDGMMTVVVYLQVHHRRPLAKKGDNQIANILPLCPWCHDEMHNIEGFVSMESDWLAIEQQRYESASGFLGASGPGRLLVRREDESGSDNHAGWLVELTPPERVVEPAANEDGRKLHETLRELQGRFYQESLLRYALVVEEDALTLWRGAWGRVRWNDSQSDRDRFNDYGPYRYSTEQLLGNLCVVDGASTAAYCVRWTEEQQRRLARFTIGDRVHPFGGRKSAAYHIEALIAPDVNVFSPAKAVVVSQNSKTGNWSRQTKHLRDLEKM